MKIYSAERKLKTQLQNNRVSIAAPVLASTLEEVWKNIKQKPTDWLLEQAQKATSAENKQPDLFYFHAILATVGVVNLNDDFFYSPEAWAARKTPEDKQINFNHNEKDIVGHMTGCFAINFDKTELLSDDLLTDEVPEKYHLVTAGVLYRKWEDADLQTRMDESIEKIANGELFVSMECLFDDFDYILFEKDSAKAEIIVRNQETAFLTEYLRGFGGTGVYKSRQVGRLLKNIIFSGKGIVEQPANKQSIIFNDNEPLKITATLKTLNDQNGEVKQMAETVKETEKTPNFEALEKQVAALTAALDTERKEKEQAKADAEKKAKADADKAMVDLRDAVAKKDEEIKGLKSDIEKAAADLKASAEKLVEAEKTIKAKSDELDKVAAEQKTQKRVALLEQNGYTNEEAVALEKKFASIDDEAFAAIAEMTKKEKKDMKKKMDESYAEESDVDEDENEAGENDSELLAQAELQKGVAGVVKNINGGAGNLLKKLQKSIAAESALCRKHSSK